MSLIRNLIVFLVVLQAAIFFTRRDDSIVSTSPTARAPAAAAKAVAKKSLPVVVPPKVEKKSAPSSVVEFREALREINDCYEKPCDLPDGDPAAYNFAVGRSLQRKLDEMTDWVLSRNVEDRAVTEIARDYLENDDGHVQEAALRLLGTQPTSLENLLAVLKSLQEGYDSNLVDPTLRELKRYTATEDLDRIQHALGEVMMTGTPFVATEISSKIDPFLTSWSIPYFKSIAQQLPEGSIFRLNLERAIEGHN